MNSATAQNDVGLLANKMAQQQQLNTLLATQQAARDYLQQTMSQSGITGGTANAESLMKDRDLALASGNMIYQFAVDNAKYLSDKLNATDAATQSALQTQYVNLMNTDTDAALALAQSYAKLYPQNTFWAAQTDPATIATLKTAMDPQITAQRTAKAASIIQSLQSTGDLTDSSYANSVRSSALDQLGATYTADELNAMSSNISDSTLQKYLSEDSSFAGKDYSSVTAADVPDSIKQRAFLNSIYDSYVQNANKQSYTDAISAGLANYGSFSPSTAAAMKAILPDLAAKSGSTIEIEGITAPADEFTSTTGAGSIFQTNWFGGDATQALPAASQSLNDNLNYIWMTAVKANQGDISIKDSSGNAVDSTQVRNEFKNQVYQEAAKEGLSDKMQAGALNSGELQHIYDQIKTNVSPVSTGPGSYGNIRNCVNADKTINDSEMQSQLDAISKMSDATEQQNAMSDLATQLKANAGLTEYSTPSTDNYPAVLPSANDLYSAWYADTAKGMSSTEATNAVNASFAGKTFYQYDTVDGHATIKKVTIGTLSKTAGGQWQVSVTSADPLNPSSASPTNIVVPGTDVKSGTWLNSRYDSITADVSSKVTDPTALKNAQSLIKAGTMSDSDKALFANAIDKNDAATIESLYTKYNTMQAGKLIDGGKYIMPNG